MDVWNSIEYCPNYGQGQDYRAVWIRAPGDVPSRDEAHESYEGCAKAGCGDPYGCTTWGVFNDRAGKGL